MYNLSDIYRPITAHPFRNNDTYIEIKPSNALKPFINCFWGSPKPVKYKPGIELKQGIVIPDTCMDIIFDIDMDRKKVTDRFSGININSFWTNGQNIVSTHSTFGIRFYFWAVPFFSDESMIHALDAFSETEEYFNKMKQDFEPILMQYPLMTDRVVRAEQYLLRKLNLDRINNNVMNAIYKLLESKGNAKISDLLSYTTTSQRQIERLFREYVGISPKRLSGLIRYQNLWQDIVQESQFDVQNAVLKYGYNDQPHLLNDFKKYHSMTYTEARKLAYNLL